MPVGFYDPNHAMVLVVHVSEQEDKFWVSMEELEDEEKEEDGKGFLRRIGCAIATCNYWLQLQFAIENFNY